MYLNYSLKTSKYVVFFLSIKKRIKGDVIMNLSKGNTTLIEVEEGKWYYLNNYGRDYSNTITSIKLEDGWIYTSFNGGEFDQEFKMKFPYTQKALNEIWQYDFKEDYSHPLDRNTDDLNWVNDIASIAYVMCNDSNYQPQPQYVIQL